MPSPGHNHTANKRAVGARTFGGTERSSGHVQAAAARLQDAEDVLLG